MKHGDKITLNWLGSDVECEVEENHHGWQLIKVKIDCRIEITLLEVGGPWSGYVGFTGRARFEKCRGFDTPQAALNELASRLGYKQPVPTAVAMMVDKVIREEEGW